MKKLLALLLAAVLITSVSPSFAARRGARRVAKTQPAAVKVVTTRKTAAHIKFFDLPLWIVPAKGVALESISKNCCTDAPKKISLEVSELQVPFKKLLNEFSASKLKNAGVTVASRENCIWNGTGAALIKAFQKDSQATMGKWILLIDRGEKTWLVSGLYDSHDASGGSSVAGMIKSLWWSGEEEAEQQTEVSAAGGIKLADTPFRLAGIRQDALVYTKDGRVPTKSPDGALFVVSQLRESRLMPDERSEFARQRLDEIEKGRPLETISEMEVTTDGLPGLEIAAYTASGPRKLIYETMLFDYSGSCLMVGIAKDDLIGNLELFHQLAASYQRSRRDESEK